jgi:hypothetical protein
MMRFFFGFLGILEVVANGDSGGGGVVDDDRSRVTDTARNGAGFLGFLGSAEEEANGDAGGWAGGEDDGGDDGDDDDSTCVESGRLSWVERKELASCLVRRALRRMMGDMFRGLWLLRGVGEKQGR